MKRIVIVCMLLSCLAFKVAEHFFEVPNGWPKPTYDFKQNPLTAEKILLGRVLFYDPILSRDKVISCASCHSSYLAFAHVDHALSHGINDSIGTRNSPALMNLAWHNTFMWDGAIHNLDMQALAPISHPAEMGSSIAEVVNKLNQSNRYRKLFLNAYGDSIATGERTLKSISQFMLTLISANSTYDKVKRHEAEFTPQQQNGYLLYQKNCSACHAEPLFRINTFKNNGLPLDSVLKDLGRMKVTQNPDDSLLFNVPTLRNIEFSYPYMHDGRFKRLKEVINHYTNGIQPSKTLAHELKEPIVLTSNEKVDLIAFLLTLSDKDFIFNPDNQYPKEVFIGNAQD